MKRILIALVALTACATQFQGDPKVPGGPQGCAAICGGWGMDFVGMIAVGEYSDGCICQVRGMAIAPAVRGAGASIPPAVGVVMQQRRAQQSAARRN